MNSHCAFTVTNFRGQMAMFTVKHDGHDWDEYLMCEVCRKPFTILERS
jgi:hypothetical protein